MTRLAIVEAPPRPRALTRVHLSPAEDLDLEQASRSTHSLVDNWPRVREILEGVARNLSADPIGETPVLSAPIVRVLCRIIPQHRQNALADRFEATIREEAVLLAAAGGHTKGPLMDWPILGGLIYRIADELNVGGVPHAGAFHNTAADCGAFRLLCRLLLEHVDAA